MVENSANQKRLGIFVGENGNWSFFREIYEDLAKYYVTDIYEKKSYRTPLLYGRLNDWAHVQRMRRTLQQNNVCFFEWVSELLLPASHMPKSCAMVARLHSYELYAWAPRVNWANVDRIILVSEAMRVKFCAMFPDHAHKTRLIYNAKKLDRFSPVARPFAFNLGMLCSIHPRKRIYEIVIMVAELRRRGYPARLHIGGGRLHGGDLDEYYVALHALVGKLDLQDAVTFYDHVDNTAEWLRNIDVFISNSYWEGHQVALIEAMAVGCQCYSHAWDGAEEVLPPENLYLSENELAEMLIAYSKLPEPLRQCERDRMRAIAVQRYDAGHQYAAIRQVIEEALAAAA
jgi:glycosyltransferase involved in cell wall biosynthesis